MIVAKRLFIGVPLLVWGFWIASTHSGSQESDPLMFFGSAIAAGFGTAIILSVVLRIKD